MKKSIYLLMTIAAGLFTSCEPMEDIHNEVNAQLENEALMGTAEFTFSDEDYEALDLGYGSFDSEADAKEMIPSLLDSKYPAWGEGSIVSVTFDVYNPSYELENFTSYEVTEEEYEPLGFKYGNFDSADDMVKFLNSKYADAAEGDVVELTYEYYAGGDTSTRTTTHIKDGGTWMEAVSLTRADYNEMGESFPNFSSRADAIADLSIFLGLKYPYAQAEDTKVVIYDLHVGGGNTEKHQQEFTFDGENWNTFGSTYRTTMQFGHNGTAWEPDNTIIYTLVPADYAYIGEQLSSKYDDPSWSAGNYNNFDRRIGNPNYWSDEMLVEAMDVLLTKIAPDAEEGQKYVMVFDIYNGAAGTEQLSMIKEGGVWVRQ